jgi:hypothetical protein
VAIAEVAGAPPAQVADLKLRLTAERESVPLDVPHHSFQGPF